MGRLRPHLVLHVGVEGRSVEVTPLAPGMRTYLLVSDSVAREQRHLRLKHERCVFYSPLEVRFQKHHLVAHVFGRRPTRFTFPRDKKHVVHLAVENS